MEMTSAQESDIAVAHKLIRADDDFVNADAGYIGIEKREEIKNDEVLSKIDYRVNERKGRRRKREAMIYKDVMNHLDYRAQPKWDAEIEYLKSKVRSKVEQVFYIIKYIFGYRKVAYQGFKKNTARLYVLFASANLLKWLWSMKPLKQRANA